MSAVGVVESATVENGMLAYENRYDSQATGVAINDAQTPAGLAIKIPQNSTGETAIWTTHASSLACTLLHVPSVSSCRNSERV